jgi:predicted HicB family RNase H-like nuclease
MSNKSHTLEYKGFIGSIEPDLEDGVIYGSVLHTTDLIMYEGSTLPELRRMFVEAVDGYIELCERNGKQPIKSFSGSFNVRTKPELHKRAALYAAKHDMNLNQLVNAAIEQYLDGENITGSVRIGSGGMHMSFRNPETGVQESISLDISAALDGFAQAQDLGRGNFKKQVKHLKLAS